MIDANFGLNSLLALIIVASGKKIAIIRERKKDPHHETIRIILSFVSLYCDRSFLNHFVNQHENPAHLINLNYM